MGGEKEGGRVLALLSSVSWAAELTSKNMTSAQPTAVLLVPQGFFGSHGRAGKRDWYFLRSLPRMESGVVLDIPRAQGSLCSLHPLHPHILEVLRDPEREVFL